MNVLLIHPPDSRHSIAPGRFEPLALEVLAATIPGHNSHILDLRIDGMKALDSCLKRLDPDITSADIPYPRRDLVQKYSCKYLSDTGHRTSLVNTSRGCPYRCSFCSIWKANSGRFFLRDIEQVYQEIVSLPKDIEYVFFADDNTFMNPGRALKLALMLEKSGIRKKYSGYCRSDTITHHPDIMKVWKNIGLNNLCVGYEVTSDDELKEVNKKNVTAHNESAARILNELGIPFRPHFLISPDFEKATGSII